jgi:hypothetical protein
MRAACERREQVDVYSERAMALGCVQACSPWHFGRSGGESSRQPLRDFNLFAAWTSARCSGALCGWGMRLPRFCALERDIPARARCGAARKTTSKLNQLFVMGAISPSGDFNRRSRPLSSHPANRYARMRPARQAADLRFVPTGRRPPAAGSPRLAPHR